MKQSTLTDDLKGLNQLSHEGFIGVTDVAESLHQNILNVGGVLNNKQKTTGLTGFIYRGVRFVARQSYQGTDWAIKSLSPLLPEILFSQQRQRWLSLLNGILGDHLVASNNPLALPMAFVQNQQTLTVRQAAKYWSEKNKRPVLMIHGLCLNEQSWQGQGRHGELLQNSDQYAPLYLRYNSGLSISENGRQLSDILDKISNLMPKNQPLDVLAHSMGGLVIRSAVDAGYKSRYDWPERVHKLVFLGTPHQGALLEKTGSVAHYLMNISPYSRPFAKLANQRSQGIQDLKTGRISDSSKNPKLANHIKVHAIASQLRDGKKSLPQHWLGDGLVAVPSALGHHHKKHRHLDIKESHQHVVSNVSHMGLLSDEKVQQLIWRILNQP